MDNWLDSSYSLHLTQMFLDLNFLLDWYSMSSYLIQCKDWINLFIMRITWELANMPKAIREQLYNVLCLWQLELHRSFAVYVFLLDSPLGCRSGVHYEATIQHSPFALPSQVHESLHN